MLLLHFAASLDMKIYKRIFWQVHVVSNDEVQRIFRGFNT